MVKKFVNKIDVDFFGNKKIIIIKDINKPVVKLLNKYHYNVTIVDPLVYVSFTSLELCWSI